MPIPVDNEPLSIYRYGRYTHEFTVVDKDEALVDLSSFTARMEIRSSPQATVLYTATTANFALETFADGTVNLAIPAGVVAAWAFTDAQYDLFVISPAGNPYPVARGRVRVYPNITDPLPADGIS